MIDLSRYKIKLAFNLTSTKRKYDRFNYVHKHLMLKRISNFEIYGGLSLPHPFSPFFPDGESCFGFQLLSPSSSVATPARVDRGEEAVLRT
jgi:hypothetical protein